ncbi:N-acetylmuramoyl-L-alanine amidase [Pseudalkalibacillus hwajinpoensis]|uniref:Sporulation protein n=1 Tax=Guptibacillus hwajinpoensis TaxID=208199 RepID=A0A4U1MG40_9BACL|nr:N-acetylmuramoyl-L-alanine amidase [Pseudalkalibacillus hwajinpoensis]TKD69266.1 sporulation protein [Pseudalkalibacillus hwajinpoensis]
MKLIVIDPGHGGSDPGATFKSYKEKNFNFLISRMVRDRLLSKYDVKVVLTRDSDKTMELKERTDLANALKPDFFLSIHHNASGGSGFESYIYNGTIPKETIQLQARIHNKIASSVLKKYQITNRGRKRANFHVLRETNMSAMLIEVLFVDNASDLKHLTNPAFIMDMSTSIADATAAAMNLPLKPAPPEGSLYKVIAGSFSKRELADDQLNRLIQKGFNAFVVTAVVNNQTVYRVQAGAFKEMENADALVERLNKAGFESFILIDKITPPEEPPKPEPEPDKGHPIQGPTILTAAQMNAYIRSINSKAPNLGALYLSHSKRYGIRGDIALAQAIHETNFFRFTGDVKPEQNNFAGLGATGGGAAGASFPDASTGVIAHLQHLYAYTSTKPLPVGDKLVDPRFSLVQRGSATTWQALNGKWAVPGTTYGQLILKHYERMVEFAIDGLEKQQEKLKSTLDNLEI